MGAHWSGGPPRLGDGTPAPEESTGRLLFHILASIDEFQRELIVKGTHEGLAAARARAYRRPEAETRQSPAAAGPSDVRRDGRGRQATPHRGGHRRRAWHQPPDGLQGTLPRGGEVTGGIHWRRETSLVCH